MFLGATLLIGILGFIVYKQIEISNRQAAIETNITAQKELANNIMRSMSQYATKDDMNKFITDNGVNLKAIQDDLDKLHAEVSAANVITVDSHGQTNTNVPSTGTGAPNPNPVVVDPANPDPFGFLKKQQTLSLNENFDSSQVPIGQIGFSAWQEKPWNINILPREYKVVNVIGTDENQKTYVYNKFTIKAGDKDYEVKINTATTEQVYPEAKFSWWNPRLFLTAGGGIGLSEVPIKGSANAGVALGIMSYGKYKNNPDISIGQIGIGYQSETQRPAVLINPVNFNIGKLVPGGLANNTYLGPSMQVDTSGGIFVGGSLSVGF